MRDREPREPTTVLDHLRPTVVVRRRVVVDVAALNQPKLESPEHAESETEPEPTRSSGSCPRSSVALEDDSAPPSSVLAPEAYDALDEEHEDEDGDQEEREAEGEEDRTPSVREPIERAGDAAREERCPELEAAHQPSVEEETPAVAPRPTIEVGPTIAVGTIAKRLGLPSAQVAAELVSRGFFEVTPATVLTRDVARIVAEAFGRDVEEVPEPEPVKAPRKRTARRAAPTKRTAKTKSKKRTGGRSTRRAA